MPPVQRFQKEDIVEAAYALVRDEGIEAVNARRIAKELHCSVQPIYRNFNSMEELRSALIEKIYQTYIDHMRKGMRAEKAYLGMGLSYIQFARECPNFFRVLFMSESHLSKEKFILNQDEEIDILQKGQAFSGLSREEQKKFHFKVWVFTHGIAVLLVNKTVNFTDGEVEELLAGTVREMLRGFCLEQKGEKR